MQMVGKFVRNDDTAPVYGATAPYLIHDDGINCKYVDAYLTRYCAICILIKIAQKEMCERQYQENFYFIVSKKNLLTVR